MFRRSVLLAALTISLFPQPAAGQADATASWCRYDDPADFEPGQACLDNSPNRLVLPMPCGRHMVFQRTPVPATDWVDDASVDFGASLDPESGGSDRPYLDGERRGHIAGPFAVLDATGRIVEQSYFIGRYEVTRLQFAIYRMGAFEDLDRCPEPSGELRRPAAGVSWFEAVDFARAYSEWLRRHHPDALPGDGATRSGAFLRLPTEAEWEYAARGGPVGATEFRAPVYSGAEGPYPPGEVAAFGVETGYEAQRVGLEAPNRLGLYDMLGNVAEIVLDPFRMVRHGRLHGQAGGYVVRGGHAKTAAARLNLANRQEYPFFDETGASRVATNGFRLVVSAPVVVSEARAEAIGESWQRLGRFAPESERGIGDDPVERLAALAADAPDPGLRRQLAALGEDIRQRLTAINEERDRALSAQLRAAAFLGVSLRAEAKRLAGLEQILERRLAIDDDPQKIARTRDNIATKRAEIDRIWRTYSDAVIAGREIDEDRLERQLREVIVALEGEGLGSFVDIARLFASHVATYKRDGRSDPERQTEWRREVFGETQ